jgi:hypothetical protein
MDWASIIIAGIGGGAGGLAGGLVGVLFPRREDGSQSLLATIVMVVLVVGGMRLLPPILEPHIGQPIREWVGGQQQEALSAEIEVLFESMPLFTVMAEKDPAIVVEVRERVLEAYRQGGLDAANAVARAEGERLGAQAVADYAPLADDASLIAFNRAVIALGQDLRETPQACYGFYYSDVVPGAARFQSAVDVTEYPSFNLMMTAMADLVRNAQDVRPGFDAERAAAVQAGMQQVLLERYSAEALQFFTGVEPANDTDFMTACDMMLDLLTYQVEHEDAVHALRSGFAG